MISKARFGTIINFMLGMILCSALSLYTLFYNKMLTIPAFLVAFIASFAVSYTFGDLVPGKTLADKLVKGIGVKEGTLIFHLISTIILDFIMVTSISFLSTVISVGFTNILFPAWLAVYPMLLLIGYVLLVIFLPFVAKMAVLLTNDK